MQKISTFRRIWVSLRTVVLVTASSASVALAQTPKAAPTTTAAPTADEAAPAGPTAEQQAAARTAFEAGKQAYDAGDFVTAEAEFRKAYEIIPVPHAEFWIASSVDKQGKDPASIVAAYELYLSNPGASHVGEDKVSEAEARVAELKKGLPAKYTFTTEPPGAAVTIDDAPQAGVTPLTVELTPGKHKIEVTLAGYETSLAEIQVEGGSTIEQPIGLTKAPEVAPQIAEPVAEPAPPRSKIPAYVTLGLGAAGLITGTVFGILALDAKGQYNDRPTSAGADDVERNALIADMSFGVALTLGITGIVLLTADDEIDEKPATASKGRLIVAPYAGPTGGGAAAHLTF